MKSVFIVPVYNEIQRLPVVLEELKQSSLACDELILFNNGSDDGSEKLIHQSGFTYIDAAHNRGVGYAIIAGIEWALAHGYQIFGGLAGNGKMLPSEMPRILDPILKGQADYVTGSRFLAGGHYPNLPGFRRLAIPLVNGYVKILTGATLTDATCGYRAFRVSLVRRAEFNWRSPWLHTYGFEYYFYAKVLLERTIRTLEVPITMRYPPRGRAYSKIPPLIGWWEMLKPWIVARMDGKGFLPEDMERNPLHHIERHENRRHIGTPNRKRPKTSRNS